MNIERLRLFVAVAETLSFTKAAEKMHLNQSNVSRYIAELENSCRAEFFERTTRNVKLTSTGSIFLVEAKKIVQNYDSIMDRITNIGKGFSGTLSIGYIEEFTRSILPKTIRSFRKKYPLVDLQFKELISKDAHQAVLDGQIDLGFFIYVDKALFSDKIESIHVQQGDISLIVSNEHPLANQKVITADKLSNETIFTYERDVAPVLYDLVSNLCIANGFPHQLKSDYINPGTIMLLVQSGLGVSILSSLATSVYQPSLYFKTLKIEGINTHSYMDLIWRKGDTNPCVHNFIQELSDNRSCAKYV